MGVITTTENGGLVYRGRYNPYLVKEFREIAGREWVPSRKEWLFPANTETLFKLNKLPGITISKDALNLVKSKEETAMMIRAAKNEKRPEPIAPMPITVNPFSHQISAFNIALHGKGAAILHEMGCGKSLVAVAISGHRYLKGEVKRVLIVSPMSVIPVWEREYRDYGKFDHRVQVLSGTAPKRVKLLKELDVNCNGELQVALINYESVWRPGIFESILKWGPDMIIADESQRIKSPSAKQAKGMHKLSQVAPYRLILTGTPVTASPLDFFSQYKFLDPSIFGTSYLAFKNRYAVYKMEGRPGGKQWPVLIGYRNKEELIKKAHSIAHRVTKADALDLPDQIDQELYCELEPNVKKAYYDMVETSIAEIEMEEAEEGRVVATNVLTKLIRLQQMVGGFLPKEDPAMLSPEERLRNMAQVSSAKLKLLRETLNDILPTGQKVVIFARFVPEIEAIKKMLDEEKFDNVGKVDYAYIYGAVKHADRGEMVEKFQNDKNCRVFIGQIQTSGLGITLHAANVAIFYSANFSYGDYDQAKARIHRIGQKHKVTYIHLIVKGTVDRKIYTALKEKKEIAAEVVDNWKQYFAEGGD